MLLPHYTTAIELTTIEPYKDYRAITQATELAHHMVITLKNVQKYKFYNFKKLISWVVSAFSSNSWLKV
jgi:hypothetical protein